MPKPKIPRVYNRVLVEHRRRVRRVAERGGAAKLKKIYEASIHDMERQLAALPGSMRDRFTAHQYRLYLGQLRQGLATISRQMSGGLGDLSRDAQTDALRGLIGDITRLEKSFTGAEVVLPIEEASRFQGVVSGVRESLLRSHEASAAKFSARLIRSMEDQLSQSLLAGEDLGSTIERITRVGNVEKWQAERIARTELMWAFNATQLEGMKVASTELPDLWMRWTENISDAGTALDDRVDGGRKEDSHAMHGQVAPVNGVFYMPNTMPNGAPIPKRASHLLGESWTNPPNRPNDRAVLSPWRPHWGIPAWRWVGGQRLKM